MTSALTQDDELCSQEPGNSEHYTWGLEGYLNHLHLWKSLWWSRKHFFNIILSVNCKHTPSSYRINLRINYNTSFLLYTMLPSSANLFSIVFCGPSSLPRYVYKSTEAKQARQSLKWNKPMQIAFVNYCVLFCHSDCFPSFLVRLLLGPLSNPEKGTESLWTMQQSPSGIFYDSGRIWDISKTGDAAVRGWWEAEESALAEGQTQLPPAPSLAGSSFPGSCHWSSWSTGTEFPRETLYLTTFFCVGIIYTTSPSDAYRIFERSFEVAVFCFAPVKKSQY